MDGPAWGMGRKEVKMLPWCDPWFFFSLILFFLCFSHRYLRMLRALRWCARSPWMCTQRTGS